MWVERQIGTSLQPVQIPSSRKVAQRDYRRTGRFPIVDQGQSRIAGWTDDEAAVIAEDLPLIVFGDHTRVVKYVDFAFVRGADGTQLLKPTDDFDPLFFYFACRSVDLEARGYNRHYQLLREARIPCPPSEEQRAIAAVLRRAEVAVDSQSDLLESLGGLKRAAMRELFTRGLRGEAGEEAEPGLMPLGWEIATIGTLVTQAQYGLSIRGEATGRYPILRMNCQQDGKVVLRDLQYVDLDEATFESYRVRPGNLLFNRTNSFELVGRTAIVEVERDAVFASYLVRLAPDRRRVEPAFLNHFLNWPRTQEELKKLASRGVSQANISAGKLKEFDVPVPPLDEQREIVAILDAIDAKVGLHRRKRAVLEELFRTLLHQLMTGAIRVGDLDLSALDAASPGRTPA